MITYLFIKIEKVLMKVLLSDEVIRADDMYAICVIFWIQQHPHAWIFLDCDEYWGEDEESQIQSVVCQRSMYI